MLKNGERHIISLYEKKTEICFFIIKHFSMRTRNLKIHNSKAMIK